jgi:hypothetical protein
MLMPDIDHAAAMFGQPRRPVHIGVAEQREAGADAFLPEAPRQDVVDLFAAHDTAPWLAVPAPASMRRTRRRNDDLIVKRRQRPAEPPPQVEQVIELGVASRDRTGVAADLGHHILPGQAESIACEGKWIIRFNLHVRPLFRHTVAIIRSL